MITATPNATRPHPLPNVHPLKTLNAPPPGPILHFGSGDSYANTNRIPDDIYQLFQNAPKNEIHVHQGGSSSVEFLSYRLRDAIERGEIDELPLYHPGGSVETVSLKTDSEGNPLSPAEVRAAKEKVLKLSNLRNYYRYQLEMDNQRPYMNNEDLAETTAPQRPEDELISAIESDKLREQKAKGLQAYRQTSSKINPFVKNNPAAYKLANEYAKSMAFENVRYTEYRVSPSGNGIGGANGSSIEDVLSAVHEGFEDARQDLRQRNYPLDYGLLVLFERQNRPGDSPDAKVTRAVQLAQEVVRLKREGKYNIAGVDLAGDEANNPVTEFKPAFDIIKEYNRTAAPNDRLGITIHAGETTNSRNLKGYESIAEAIRIAHDPATPVRIGHGLQVINSSQTLKDAFETYRKHPLDWERRIDKQALLNASPLLDSIIKKGVVLEMCPKSNLQTYGIHPGFPEDQFEAKRSEYSAKAYSRHPAVFLSRLGVKIAISSDNRTISNTDVTNEFVKLFKYAGLTYKDFKQMVLNGFEGAFIADSQKKQAIIRDVNQQFARLERNPDHIRAIHKMGSRLALHQRLILLKDTIVQTGQQVLQSVLNWLTRLLANPRPTVEAPGTR